MVRLTNQQFEERERYRESRRAYPFQQQRAAALADGLPQNEDAVVKEKSGPLPFLQFTNGGIRLNFGGYHAEAGLGGLLRGTGMGGGLHASAGTPWGAHAGAGLGGGLMGEDGRLGGGLYARAGLGPGRPEAAAGLGGSLDGSGRALNPIAGGMYAGATPGGGPGTGVYLGGGLDRDEIDAFAGATDDDEIGAVPRATGGAPKPPTPTATATTAGETATTTTGEASATTSGETKPTRRTNIQIIPSRKKKPQPEKERAALEVAALPADASADGKVETRVNEVRRAVKYVAVPPLPLPLFAAEAPVVKSVTKTVVAAAPADAVAAVPARGDEARANNADATTAADDTPSIPFAPRPVYPRWYFRKRFWNAPRKVIQVAPTAADSRGASSDVVGGLYADVGKNGDAVITAGKAYGVSGSLFDDIFNIPISALAAVNQLLRNNVG